MVPPQYLSFFATSSGAAAALIGLLFVAISLAPERTVMVSAPRARRAVAASAFTGLFNAFFVSLGALIPHANLGYFALFLGAFGITDTLPLAWELRFERHAPVRLLRKAFLVLSTLSIYSIELVVALALIRRPTNSVAVERLTWLLIAVFAMSLLRAWELLGARRSSVMGWLSTMRDLDE